MTKKAFWTDPYQTLLTTTVATVAGPEVTLESSIFFAFSGGQESDSGSIGGHPVLSARRQASAIVYGLPSGHGLSVGQTVRIEIDWKRRYRIMRLHFAAELVLELFYRSLAGISKVGAHIAEDKARIDFAWPDSIAPLLPAIRREANEIIAADLEIRTGYVDGPGERRYWEIDGFLRVACGGTHVRRTGEIGPVSLRRNNRGRGTERVEIYLDA